jgi:ClpP class serine protease
MGGVLTLDDPHATTPRGAVALVHVNGPLAQRATSDLCAHVDGYDAIAARFTAALTDPRTSGVVLVLDSPGGDVAGLEECVRRMREAKVASGKPVAVFVDETAASAAYWIAAGLGAPIYGPGACRVGSIGIIGALIDETERLKKEGISVTLIRDPDGKAEGHPAGPIGELAIARAKERVSACAARFFEAVASARSVPVATVRGWNGAMFSGPDAVRAGLLTAVQSLEETVATLTQNATAEIQAKAKAYAATLNAANATARAGGASTLAAAAAPSTRPVRGSAPSSGGLAARLGLTAADFAAAEAAGMLPPREAGHAPPAAADGASKLMARIGLTEDDVKAAGAAGVL